ncbi:MAG: AAA family ATPase [Thermoguttaceae bacterium]|jgi:MoxR-like ATPase
MDASTGVPMDKDHAELGRRLTSEVLAPMKAAFVAKDEVIDLLGVCLVAGENLFILGPPGTAKSALVQDLAARIDGRVFDYLLTRFTEPNELFGPFDIRKLREGELVTNTEGMLPEASLAFLDELLNANSAILNSLLMVLNERVFRRGRETRALPLLMAVGASNRLPEDDALGALFDRFLMRVRCDNVAAERMQELLVSGWKLDLDRGRPEASFGIDDVRRLHAMLGEVELDGVRPAYVELIHRLRYAGIRVSDRRAVKLQRLMAASALLCGRLVVHVTDLWVLRYLWDTEDQQEILASLVQEAIDKSPAEEQAASHPRSRGADAPDADSLARDLEHIADRLGEGPLAATDQTYLKDRLGLLAGRCQWVADKQQRAFLEQQIEALWKQLGVTP